MSRNPSREIPDPGRKGPRRGPVRPGTMRKASTLRILCTVLAALVVAAAGLSVTLRVAHEPTSIEAAAPMPDSEHPPDATTSTSTGIAPTTTTPAVVPTPVTTTPPAPPPATTPEVPPTDATSTLRPSDQGPAVLSLQNRLRDLGYWLGTPDGAYGLLAEQAVTAFQKVEGLAPDGVAGSATRAALAVAERPTTASAGDLIEVDKGRQVMFVVRDGAVAWTVDVSTGTRGAVPVERADSAGRHPCRPLDS